MEFFPLTLGLPKPRPIRREGDHADEWRHRTRDEDAWRESLSAPPEEVEEFAEAAMLALLRAALPDRPWVILGEPGAGKSWLLEHWHASWLRGLGATRLGMAVPVLVRLRELAPETMRGKPEAVADRLWDHALAAGQAVAKGCASASVLDRPGRLVTPVWLLDGLDEVSGHPGDAALWDTIGALPGAVALTCRTAVFQQVQREVAGRHTPPWRILDLKPGDEQTAYLRLALDADGKDPARAPALIRALDANAALRPLAASPLLLSLVAEVCDTLTLPANRAAFYTEATRTLWQRKLAGRAERALTAERDAALAALAETTGVARIEADETALVQAAITGPLREALRVSGLLTFDERRERVAFPHLTFQEFHLARAWLGRPLRDVLDAHWADLRAEEALGLLLALHDAASRRAEVEAVLQAFVSDWRARHRADPSVLWRIGRSPMRVALRLLARAGIVLTDPLLGASGAPAMVRIAIARMAGIAPAALTSLALDANSDVRQSVAWNTATSLQTLAILVNDTDAEVRWRATHKMARMPDTVAAFAEDEDAEVRRGVAGNTAAPAETLAALATDADAEVRRRVAGNPATPPETLAALAKDANADVRSSAGENTGTPPETLATLTKDNQAHVRGAIAQNAATTLEALAALAEDNEVYVRWRVAQNTATPPKTLATLAKDASADVRRGVAENATMSPDTLAVLAKDAVADVRQSVARNGATTPGTLAALANDAHPDVRWRVALNPATPSGTLSALAKDADAYVRECVAWNRATPPETLAALAEDADADVRKCVAWNRATPPETLAALAEDADAEVRRCVASNPATPPDALGDLALDAHGDVRRCVAENPATPPDALGALAKDADAFVRRRFAANQSTLLEDLYAAED